MTKAQWRLIIKDAKLQRSSHITSVIDNDLYVFGGELVPREPRDNKVFSINLAATEPSLCTTSPATAPSPRVGSASASLNGNLYLFSGRGGIAMAPIEENGALWEYSPSSSSWSLITPDDPSARFPPCRSYHTMASDGQDRIFVHAGCPESGRLSDMWSFGVKERKWTPLTDAPGPQRGGTSIAFSGGRLYRMNGFDGKSEQGGSLDVFDLPKNTWSTKNFAADGATGPEARSVSALLPLRVNGRDVLVSLFGERDPSSLGHAGAGKMLGDVWLYDIERDAWSKIETGNEEPPPRGWFDADVVDGSTIVVVGGLSETNERLDDVWTLSF